MRIIDRLFSFINDRKLTAYAFEKSCGVANGYLKKQQKGKGSIGSDILEKIHQNYLDLSLIWLLTGEGNMLLEPTTPTQRILQEERAQYTRDEHMQALKERIKLLETLLRDKEKIIKLMEERAAPGKSIRPE